MKREQITIVNFYNVFPFNHGGSQEILGFCKGISEYFDVNLVIFNGNDMSIHREEIMLSNHIKVITISYPKPLVDEQDNFYKQYGFNSKTLIDNSIFANRYFSETQKFIEKLKGIACDSRIVITVHPYTYQLLKKNCADKIIWYRAQNVEYNYKKATWNKIEKNEQLLQEVYELEMECCKGSDLILTITQDDADNFHKMYDIPHKKILNISAGYNLDNLDFILPSIRGADSNKISALFISSAASVAVQAANNIIEIAKETPLIKYVIVGNVGNKIDKEIVPKNVHITGIVSEAQKVELLKTSDVALNLIEGGSGLNMKMLEYFAYGIPVITTEFGARGLDVIYGKNCLITNESSYKNDIVSFCEIPISKRDEIALNALELLKRDYDWRSIAKKVIFYVKDNYPDIYDDIKSISEKDAALFPIPESKSFMLEKNRPLLVWGAGELGISCLDTLIESGIFPLGFIDNNHEKWGRKIRNIEIFPPERFFYDYKDIDVIIAVYAFMPILTQISKGGVRLENIFIAFEGKRILPLREGYLPYYISYEKLIKLVSN